MKMKMLCGLLLGTLALAGSALGATYTDAATNYVAGWTNGSNGGTGFKAWDITADSGTNGWAGNGIWDSTNAGLAMGEAFGFGGRGTGTINLNRSFSQAMNTNDSFEFDYGINYDSGGGNKGFNLYANGIEVINVNNDGSAAITLGGNPALANYGTQTMHWVFTQVAADKIGVHATGRDGVETFATTVTVANGYGYIGAIKFYAAYVSDDFTNQRQSYFNHLSLTEEGTAPPDPSILVFTGGKWNPSALGDYPFELTRSGAVGDEIVLTSSNTNAVTVPDGTNFITGSNTVSFNATVVSLTAGDATIIASNVASGAWAEFNVRAPVLSFSAGVFNPSATGEYVYTILRFAGVTDEILLSSSAPSVLTVPATVSFTTGVDTVSFTGTVVSLTGGPATIIASNTATGVWAEYVVTPVLPAHPELGPLSYAGTILTISTPSGFVPATVWGADCVVIPSPTNAFPWVVMTNGVEYTVSGVTNVVIPTVSPAPSRRLIRVDLLPI